MKNTIPELALVVLIAVGLRQIALVIFPALSRLQNDPERLRSCRRSCPCRIR
jgi:hypothetical protein